MTDVTQILSAIEQGDPKAAEQLLPLVYNELRNLAIQKLGRVPPGQTLQPTALVHEAYLRLVGGGDQLWDSRGHFFAAAAEAMRRILVENARKKGSRKRGGDRAARRLRRRPTGRSRTPRGPAGPGRGPRPLGRGRFRSGAAGAAPLLRGADARRGGESHGCLPADGRSPLGLRPGVVASGPRRRRLEGAAIPKQNGVIPPPISHW